MTLFPRGFLKTSRLHLLFIPETGGRMQPVRTVSQRNALNAVSCVGWRRRQIKSSPNPLSEETTNKKGSRRPK